MKTRKFSGALTLRRWTSNIVVSKIRTAFSFKWAGITQSVQRIATGWTVRGWNPDGGEVFCTSPDRPWGPPSPLFNWHRVFTGGKAAGAWR